MTESQHGEYKKSFGKEVIITLVAFANIEGGRVIVGMGDDGQVCGLDVGPETVQRYLNEIKVSTYPQIIPKTTVQNEAGIVLSCAEQGDFFRVELRMKGAATPPITPPIIESAGERITTLESRILALIAESPAISSRKIAEAMNISRDTVKEYLARLKSRGILTRVGSRRGGFWKIRVNNNDSTKY